MVIIYKTDISDIRLLTRDIYGNGFLASGRGIIYEILRGSGARGTQSMKYRILEAFLETDELLIMTKEKFLERW